MNEARAAHPGVVSLLMRFPTVTIILSRDPMSPFRRT